MRTVAGKEITVEFNIGFTENLEARWNSYMHGTDDIPPPVNWRSLFIMGSYEGYTANEMALLMERAVIRILRASDLAMRSTILRPWTFGDHVNKPSRRSHDSMVYLAVMPVEISERPRDTGRPHKRRRASTARGSRDAADSDCEINPERFQCQRPRP